MKLILEDSPFEYTIYENITVLDGNNTYTCEVEIMCCGNGGKSWIDVNIQEHGLNSSKEDEIKEFVEKEFQDRYKINRIYE